MDCIYMGLIAVVIVVVDVGDFIYTGPKNENVHQLDIYHMISK